MENTDAITPDELEVEPDSLDSVPVLGRKCWELWCSPILTFIKEPKSINQIQAWCAEQNQSWDHVRSCLAWLSVKDLATTRSLRNGLVWVAADCMASNDVTREDELTQLANKSFSSKVDRLLHYCNNWLETEEFFFSVIDILKDIEGVAYLKSGPAKYGVSYPTLWQWHKRGRHPSVKTRKQFIERIKIVYQGEVANVQSTLGTVTG